MDSDGQLKRKNPSTIYSDDEDEQNIIVQIVSTNTNITHRGTQEQSSQSVASNSTGNEQQQHQRRNKRTISADTNMNIAQRETQEHRIQAVASNTVEQQQQNVEQRHTHRKKKKRLSANFVEYGMMKIFRIRFYFRIFTKIIRLRNSCVSHQNDFLISFSSNSFDTRATQRKKVKGTLII